MLRRKLQKQKTTNYEQKHRIQCLLINGNTQHVDYNRGYTFIHICLLKHIYFPPLLSKKKKKLKN